MDGEEKFSILERYGENYTEKEYITNPAIGRDQQIKELILILLTPEKSAILVGKPGIGKTAIVEGLAYAMQRKEVPDALLGYTIINIKTASLLGTMPSGESKVQAMIDELKKKDKVILFVDEIHMLIGATDESALDFANIFKEGLGRGSIKVVGATTTEEYERYILRDKAFTRRFQKIEVPEPTRDETVKILMGTLPKIEKTTGTRMKYSKYQQELIMGFIVDLTSEYKRVFEIGSRYPDVSLTLMKSAFSFAVFDNRKDVTILDFEKAIVNTHLVYPDVIKKELPIFKEKFKDIYDEEAGIYKEGIVVKDKTSYIPSSTIATSNPYVDDASLQEISRTINSSDVFKKENQKADLNISSVTPVSEKEEPKQSLFGGFNQNVMRNHQFGGMFYTSKSVQSDSMYEKPVRVSAMGRDDRTPPPRDNSTAIDGVLLDDKEMQKANTNFSLELNLDDVDDIDNKNDDFYERDE